MLRPIRVPFAVRPLVKALWEFSERERRAVLSEVVQIKGLMPLLMKQRNRQQWTSDDKAELARQLHHLSAVSPYLVLFVMPGGFFLLPAVAWWLDRRRVRRLAQSLI